ncbi:gamma-glutamyltransferase [Roseibium salinum]|nr:gamma-glutamyltransferase [Roseibium salinum]
MARTLKFVLCAVSVAVALIVPPGQSPQAQESPIYSLRDRFQPVTAENGMVASQEAVATGVGVDILQKGGNAVDAAIATGFALAVTLPRAGNLGGGGFMLIHMAESGETKALDYREKGAGSRLQGHVPRRGWPTGHGKKIALFRASPSAFRVRLPDLGKPSTSTAAAT